MSTLKEKAMVVMLPTKKVYQGYNLFKTPMSEIKGNQLIRVTELRFQKIEEEATIDEFSSTFKSWIPQGIYIITNQKPSIGDWSLNLNSNYEHKEICHIDNEYEQSYVQNPNNDCRKIIISNDPRLGIAEPSDGFLRKFESQYNKKSPIQEVVVEYQLRWQHTPKEEKKLVTKNNVAKISPLKDSFTRAEVESLMKQSFNAGYQNHLGTQVLDLNQWCKKTLPL